MSGERPDSYWGEEIRDRIARQVDGIRHWEIIHGGYDEAPEIEATWFVDPPYHRSGKHYRYSEVDYDGLGAWCRKLKGQVVVCEQKGATWLPFSTFRAIRATPGKRGSGTSNEVIWTSGASPPEQVDMF